MSYYEFDVFSVGIGTSAGSEECKYRLKGHKRRKDSFTTLYNNHFALSLGSRTQPGTIQVHHLPP